MNNDFKKGRKEFKEKHYEEALFHFDKITEEDEDFEYSLVYRIGCLIELKRYGDALEIINPLIAKNPYDELLWFDKVTCHIFLKEDEKAFKALDELERVVDMDDKGSLVYVAKFYNMLGDFDNSLRFCDKALEIDENYKDALYEKSSVAIHLNDAEMIEKIADKLFEISNKDLLSLTPIILLKLFSKNYGACLDLIENSIDDDVKDETIEMFKFVVYKELSESLNAQILMAKEVDMSIDDALKLMFDFKENGCNHGEIHGVKYIII